MERISRPFSAGGGSEFFLGIGEVAFAKEPCVIRTVLGSCVGVALFDPVLGLGGMCHYLLARAPRGEASTRYGDVALETLIGHFLSSGSRLDRLEAYMAGGGLILDMKEVFFVGEKNVQVADEILAARGLRPRRREVGGPRGRRMVLDTGSGKVDISLIPDSDPERQFAV